MRLCDVFDRHALLADPRFADFDSRLEHADELLYALAEQERTWKTDLLTHTLLERGLAYGNVYSYDEVLASPEAQQCGIFGTVDATDGGPTRRSLNLPYRIKSWPAPELSKVASVGAHSREALRMAGLSDGHLDELVAAGIVGVSE